MCTCKNNTIYHITLHKVKPALTMTALQDQLIFWVCVVLSEVLKQSLIYILCIISSSLPDYVVVVAQVKFLLMLPGIVHNSHTGDKIHYLLGGGVVQVVAALMAPVSVDPLQSQVAVGSSPVSHVRTSVCLSVAITKAFWYTVIHQKGFILSPCVPLVPLHVHRCSESVKMRHFFKVRVNG